MSTETLKGRIQVRWNTLHLFQPPHSLYFLLMSFESGIRDTLHIGIFPKMVTTATYANYFLDKAHQD